MSIEKKIGFADITRIGALLEEAFINTTKMTEIRKSLKEIHNREHKKICSMYRLSELYCSPLNTTKKFARFNILVELKINKSYYVKSLHT